MKGFSKTIIVTGHPVAKGRGRVGNVNGRPVVFTPAKTRAWQNDARQIARLAMKDEAPFAGCVHLMVHVYFLPAKAWPVWKREAALHGRIRPSGRPDLDNLVKAAKDALNGIVWLDDAQVVSIEAEKDYSESPGVKIKVKAHDSCPSQITKRSQLQEARR